MATTTYYKPGSSDIYVGIREDNPNYASEIKRLQDMGWTTSPTGGTTSAPTTSAPAPTTSASAPATITSANMKVWSPSNPSGMSYQDLVRDANGNQYTHTPEGYWLQDKNTGNWNLYNQPGGTIIRTTNPYGGTTNQGGNLSAPTTSTGYTPPQFTNNNNQVYKEWNQETGTWDVFDSSGKSIDLATFKNMGLNIDHINTMNQIQQRGDMSNQPGVQEQPEEPPSNFADDYKKNLDASGAASIKSQAEDYIKQLGELQNDLNDQIAEVNDNPWLAEGVRDAKVKKLQERYEGKIKILTSQAALFNNLYEQAIAEAKFLTTGEQADRNTMLKLAQEQQQLEFDMWKELNNNADTQIVEHDGGKWLINMQTSEEIYLGKATSKPTESSIDQYEANTILARLLASKQGGEYVDGNVFAEERARSRLSASDFNSRFGSYLSPEDRKKFGVDKTSGSAWEEF